MGWCEEKFRYWSVWVGFLYTRNFSPPSSGRKDGQQAMNREEEGSYQLSHAYDRFLGTGLLCQEPEEETIVFILLTKNSDGG